MSYIGRPAVRPCEYEDKVIPCIGPVLYRSSMTRYHFEGELDSPEDPNRPIALCEDHWEMYHDHWSSMWDEYYNSRY